MEDIKRVIYEEVKKCEEGHITDWSTIKSNLKDTLSCLYSPCTGIKNFGFAKDIINFCSS